MQMQIQLRRGLINEQQNWGRGGGGGEVLGSFTLNLPLFLTSYWLSSVKRFLLGYYITAYFTSANQN